MYGWRKRAHTPRLDPGRPRWRRPGRGGDPLAYPRRGGRRRIQGAEPPTILRASGERTLHRELLVEYHAHQQRERALGKHSVGLRFLRDVQNHVGHPPPSVTSSEVAAVATTSDDATWDVIRGGRHRHQGV